MDVRTLEKWLKDPSISQLDRLVCVIPPRGNFTKGREYTVFEDCEKGGHYISNDVDGDTRTSRVAVFYKMKRG